jgi:DNA helicase-2/ATP-dependent DNA helicase PcrA
MGTNGYLDELNPAQRQAVEHGIDGNLSAAAPGPLLIIAGAGSGKTKTLAHRVAHLILHGASPERLLLLTFTRRAAQEMTRRAQHIVAQACSEAKANASRSPATVTNTAHREPARISWSGTFHSVANRLLRIHAEWLGLAPSFTVLDRSDSEDLIDLLRHELGFSQTRTRFPRKGTCVAIYSQTVNAARPFEETLARAFPWCEQWSKELRALFRAYVEAKQQRCVLDYDDLLLYWHRMMEEPVLAEAVRGRFDHVLVDEYQDTNTLQAAILLGLRPEGSGLTVVGDDAQSIYSFRSATVRNILDFPNLFDPPATVVKLEQNYRSTQTILNACNAVIGLSQECVPKRLFSTRPSRQPPVLVTAEDEIGQVDYLVDRILENREAGIELKRQAVLFRAAHHSDPLEIELVRRDIPFVKYGGLKFLEAAHVKDMICTLRWAENPRDSVAAFRVLQLLPGMGPGNARRALDLLYEHRLDFAALCWFPVPAAAAEHWLPLCGLLEDLAQPRAPWPSEIGLVRAWYQPHLERLYESPQVRAGDLEQLEAIAAAYPSRERFLTELTIDPPEASGDEARKPLLDEDYLILSTIHSAKGQEWEVVYVLNVADGCIPTDMATTTPEQIEEERRVLYVAMTRARNQLHLVHPLRFFVRQQRRHGDRHVYTPRTRFIPDSILGAFECRSHGRGHPTDPADTHQPRTRIDIGTRLREMWE